MYLCCRYGRLQEEKKRKEKKRRRRDTELFSEVENNKK